MQHPRGYKAFNFAIFIQSGNRGVAGAGTFEGDTGDLLQDLIIREIAHQFSGIPVQFEQPGFVGILSLRVYQHTLSCVVQL